ncbi:MAG: hypoxanthine phosphoribosyltransferase [Clostridia bacterium]|nr:hypoxanthine phosphoribosyltransferase [Clostridia bacterium]
MEKIYKDIERVLISKEEIAKRVKEIGAAITKDFVGEEIVVVSVLKGSSVFMSDLIREIDLPMDIDFLVASSYENTTSSGNVQIIKDINIDVENRVVIIVEDIIDSGLTMYNLTQLFNVRKCKEFKICTLLDKQERRRAPVKADYIGFDVPNEFVVGYGLDYNGKYRNLPEICVLKPEIYE